MKRREFLGRTMIAAGAAALGGWPRQLLAAPGEDSSHVTRVLAVFKCHLDVGFSDTQANVVRKYFDQYFPLAIKTGASLRAAGQDHYVWTTGSWLLYEYLEQANAQDRRQMEQARHRLARPPFQLADRDARSLHDRRLPGPFRVSRPSIRT